MDRLTQYEAGHAGICAMPILGVSELEVLAHLAAYEDTGLTPEEVAALRAELDAFKADSEAGRMVRLPDTLITPYELNERYWVCGWNSERCTMTIQDRKMLVAEAARAALGREA